MKQEVLSCKSNHLSIIYHPMPGTNQYQQPSCIVIRYVVNFDALAPASDFRIERRQVVFPCCRIRTQRVSGTESPADWMPAGKPTELSRIKLKSLLSNSNWKGWPKVNDTFSWNGHTLNWLFSYHSTYQKHHGTFSPGDVKWLTHWGRVTHLCVSKLTINGSDNGRRSPNTWSNVGILLIRPWEQTSVKP